MNGIELRARREALGLSQTKFAKMCETTQVTVSRWENGTREPRNDIAIHLLLANIEDAAIDLIEDLLELAEDEELLTATPDLQLTVYNDEARYAAGEPVWSKRLPMETHRVCAARAAAVLGAEDGTHVTLIEG